MSVFVPVPHFLDYYNFTVIFEIGKCESFDFVIIFQNCFVCSQLLAFLYEFLDYLVNFCKKVAEILIRAMLNL